MLFMSAIFTLHNCVIAAHLDLSAVAFTFITHCRPIHHP